MPQLATLCALSLCTRITAGSAPLAQNLFAFFVAFFLCCCPSMLRVKKEMVSLHPLLPPLEAGVIPILAVPCKTPATSGSTIWSNTPGVWRCTPFNRPPENAFILAQLERGQGGPSVGSGRWERGGRDGRQRRRRGLGLRAANCLAKCGVAGCARCAA